MNIKEEIHKWRQFLDRNRIFLDVLVSFFVGVMAIVVSIQANSIARKQTIIMESQSLPQFVVSSVQQQTEVGNEYSIIVNNDGGTIGALSHDTAVILNVKYNDKYGKMKEINIPINNFYNSNYYSGNGKGKLLIISGTANADNIVDLIPKLNSKGGRELSLAVFQYIKINYQDVFNRKHTDYLFVPWTSIGWKIENKIGEQIFAQYYEENNNAIDFKTVTSKQLLKIMNL